ncbi:MAG TPA: DUF4037 domain-containing protein [Thermomicrobiales bacterium]|nr:DUF4037 domain-containing protein [Thermomicrobiales bacterium]
MSPPFTPGLVLSRRFYEEAVRPILNEHVPDLAYAAALIGPGSEVLGFDTPISTDHHWGPRVMLFLSERDAPLAASIDDALSRQLPPSFLGYSTNFGPPDEVGVRLLQVTESGPIAHRVEIRTVAGWFTDYLGWDTAARPSIVQWLTFPQHRLCAATAGEVFRDDTGELTSAREALVWYPHDLWLYLLAAQWNRIAEEEAFMARTGDVGDELGSKLVAARIVKDIMRLCFLMERRYPPYAKWFGRAFRLLKFGTELEPFLLATIDGATWRERERALSIVLERLAAAHNELGITNALDHRVQQYYGRPYRVIGADRFASAIEAHIVDDAVRSLPARFGSLNQLIDSTDTIESATTRVRLASIYHEPAGR